MRNLSLITVLALVALSCKTTKSVQTTATTVNPIAQLLDTASVLSQSFSGLILYDFEKKQTLFERNANRYFTPASNTKLYTFYACLKTLKDSIPALRYVINGDSMIFWGTGDPTFLHPDFPTYTRAFEFLKANTSKKLYFSHDNFTNDAYGAGWQWDDYNDYYQAELSPFPINGNIVRVSVKNGKMDINPPFFKDSFHLSSKKGNAIIRNIDNNQFEMPTSIGQKTAYEQDIPFKTSLLLTQKMLSDALKTPVGLVKIPMPKNAQILYSMPTDTVYKQMLQVSDNMLAEHLLFLAGSSVNDTVNTSLSIDYIKKTYMKDLPDTPKWEDGSGLSRYNLFTPRTTIKLLEKIYAERPQDKIFPLLPTGGVGTLGNVYKSDKPYIFAKSGSLSGVYNLSGYLITQKGKLLLFSFMNNNFIKSTSSVRKEVERILTWVHLNY